MVRCLLVNVRDVECIPAVGLWIFVQDGKDGKRITFFFFLLQAVTEGEVGFGGGVGGCVDVFTSDFTS